MNYLKPQINKEKIVTLIVGGPTKYYTYNEKVINEIFSKIKRNFISKGFQLIFIPSMRTPLKIIDAAKNFFDKDQIIITKVDKKAYLSSLKLSDYIVVTCDSTSMISESAITGKPIYVAQIPSTKENKRFIKFFELFKSLNIIKDLDDTIEEWNYEKLNETDRISSYIKEEIKIMNFLNSILNKSKKHEFPFDHWEYNDALSDNAIEEIMRADIPDVSEYNLFYDGTRAIDGGAAEFRKGIASGGKALKFRCFVTNENAAQFPNLVKFIKELQSKKHTKQFLK